MEVDRKVAQSADSIKEWLKKFHDICLEFNIFPEDIWNGDESGFRVGMGKHQFVITLNGDKEITLGSSTCRELVTVIECISGGGKAIPPMVILPGILHMQSWYESTDMEDEFLLATSDTGYSHDEYGLEWLKHVERFTKLHQKGKYR